MRRLDFAPLALADIDEIAGYVAAQDPQAAARLIARIKERAISLAERPGLGRPREELAPKLRSVAIASYALFYRPLDDGIEVARVLHGRRDIDAVFGADG